LRRMAQKGARLVVVCTMAEALGSVGVDWAISDGLVLRPSFRQTPVRW
jgi:hypothetical protein